MMRCGRGYLALLLLLIGFPAILLSEPPPVPMISGVTPGAVSPVMLAIPPQQDASELLTLFTEDRHGQFIELGAEVPVISRATGLRRVSAGAREHGGTAVLVGDRGRWYRFDASAERSTVIRTLPGEVQQLWRDGRGNFIARTGAGDVMHISAAGTLMWDARPGGGAVTGEWIHGRVVLLSATGGLVQIDDTGAMVTLLPPPESRDVSVLAFGAARIREGGAPALVVVTQHGSVERWEQQRINQDRDGNVHIHTRRTWRWVPAADLDRPPTLLGTDVGGNHWLLVDENVVYVITPGGDLLFESADWSKPFAHIALEEERGVLWIADQRGGVQTISADGVVSDSREFEGVPQVVRYARESSVVVMLYDDWSYNLFRSATARIPPSAINPIQLPVPRNTSATAPLRTLADAALEGSSVSEREALLRVIRERMNRRVLMGQVGLVQDILIRLATEPYRADGPDFPTVRTDAVRLLGRFSDAPSRRELTHIVEQDPSVIVVSRALRELSEFPRDQYGAVPAAMERFRTTQRPQDRNAIAAALIAYLENLPRDTIFFRTNAELGQSDIPLDLRRRAHLLEER